MFLKLLAFFAEIPEDSIRLRWRLKGKEGGSGPRLQDSASARNIAFVSVVYIGVMNSGHFLKNALKTLHSLNPL